MLLVTNGIDASSATIAARKPKSDLPDRSEACENHIQVVDKCATMATYSFVNPLNPLPTNVNEMKPTCNRINEGLKCLRARTKCFAGFTKRVLIVYTNSRSKHSKSWCNNLSAPQTTLFFRSNQCIKERNKSPRLLIAEKNFISKLQRLTNMTMKWEQRFHSTCCVAESYRLQVIKEVGDGCPEFVTPHEDLINSMIGEMLEAVCPDANRLKEICSKLPKVDPLDVWKPKSLTGAALDLIEVLSRDDPSQKN